MTPDSHPAPAGFSNSRSVLSALFLILAAASATAVLYLIVTGNFGKSFLADLFLTSRGLKKIRNPMVACFLFYLAAFFVRHGLRIGWDQFYGQFQSFAARKSSIWILAGIYAVLFTWFQVNAYLSLEIHFLPFEYYDYMTYWFTRGKAYFTGCLHGFYHLESIMALFVPLWLVFKTPMLFLVSYALLLSAAVIPLFYFAKNIIKDAGAAFLIAFAFLNFKYLFHGLDMNFSPEGFYPLTVFLVALYTVRGGWLGLFISLALGLLIKEDAPFYFIGLGFYYLFFKDTRIKAVAIIGASLVWLAVLLYVLGPMSGANHRYADTLDIYGVGTTTFHDTLIYFATHPLHVVTELFYPWIKTRTLFSFFTKLLFLPLLTPALIVTLAPIGTVLLTRQMQWMTFGYHYALHIIPFAFIALVYGFRNVLAWLPRYRPHLIAAIGFGLALANAGNYFVRPVTADDLKTIKLAKSVPQEGACITLGHLMPYVGYREENCYLSSVVQVGHKKAFDEARYVLFADGVNTYGAEPEYLTAKKNEYLSGGMYEKVYEDDLRLLLKRKDGTI